MNEIRQLIDSAAFSDLDRHFAGFIEAQAGGDRPLLALAAALTSHTRTEGHICLDLQAMMETSFPERPVDGVNSVRLPGLAGWLRDLTGTPVVGAPGQFSPLILDARHRVYLHRYWEYEQTLAAEILRRSRAAGNDFNEELLRQSLKTLFPQDLARSINLQSVAAFAAVRSKFCVISGGPGTGKTHTLVLILALLSELDSSRKLRISVTAPTGKAATRIQDSLRNIKATLACSEEIKASLPENATTIHRLLGYIPDSASFRHNADNLLPFDVIAVDEASMVDLALMSKLFQAIPPSARVILLGDKDQLASVEAGSVLGDICSAVNIAGCSKQFSQHFEKLTGQRLPAGADGKKAAALSDCVVQLRKNYRFGVHSAIFRLSNAINEGCEADVFGVLDNPGWGANSDLMPVALPSRTMVKDVLRERVLVGFGEFLKASDPLQAIAALARFRVLCALRAGHFGVTWLNQLIEQILEEARLINCQGPWYPHRPIMITRNDYNLKLFNGDNGVILNDGAGGGPRAFFAGPDNSLRQFLPIRLPEHETAYAMTVHKSQGSEFDRILLVLPDRQSPVLTRELLYTGITRARKHVELWFEEKTFRTALAKRVRRTSGLCDALAE